MDKLPGAAPAVYESVDNLRKAGNLGAILGGGYAAAGGGAAADIAITGGIGGVAGVVMMAIFSLLANFRKPADPPESDDET